MNISILDIQFPNTIDNISQHEIRKSIRQYFSRKRKIRNRKKGHQDSWLLCAVSKPKSFPQHDESLWVTSVLNKLIPLAPNSAYKLMMAHIVENLAIFLKDHQNSYSKVLSLSLEEGFHILMFPLSGILAFSTPPGNLKHSLESGGISCDWNWGIESILQNEPNSPHSPLSVNVENYETSVNVKNLQKKYRYGKNAKLAVIDSAICDKATECNDRIIQRIAIKPHKKSEFLWDFTEGRSQSIHHGTQVASVAAGTKIGIAPKSKIVSFELPLNNKRYYNPLALVTTIEAIVSHRGPLIDGGLLPEVLSTILIPSGYIGKKKMSNDIQGRLQDTFRILFQDYNIVTVAAIGNEKGKVAFPAGFQYVYATGSLDESNNRSKKSGFGEDDLSCALPDGNVFAENLPCQFAGGHYSSDSGSSLAAAYVAGLFTLLADRIPTAQGRLSKMKNALNIEKDQYGDLKIIDIDRL